MSRQLTSGVLGRKEDDITVYLNSLTTPLSSNQINVLRTNIVGLKKDLNIKNLRDAFDVILHLSSETAEGGLKNLVKRDNDATAVNGCVHTPYVGYNGDGATKYVDMNYIPATDGVNWKLTSASLGVFKQENETGVFYDMGGYVGNIDRTFIVPRLNSAGNIRLAINGGDVFQYTPPEGTNPNSIALYSNHKIGSLNTIMYRNDVEMYNEIRTVGELSTQSIFVCGVNNNGSLLTAAPSTKQLGLSFAGRGFSASEMVYVSYWFNKLVAETKALL